MICARCKVDASFGGSAGEFDLCGVCLGLWTIKRDRVLEQALRAFVASLCDDQAEGVDPWPERPK